MISEDEFRELLDEYLSARTALEKFKWAYDDFTGWRMAGSKYHSIEAYKNGREVDLVNSIGESLGFWIRHEDKGVRVLWDKSKIQYIVEVVDWEKVQGI